MIDILNITGEPIFDDRIVKIILLLYDHWGDSQMVLDACYQFIFTTAFIARVLHNIWNQNRLQQLCIAIDKHWDIFTSDVEVRIMKHYAMLSRRFTIVFSNCFEISMEQVLTSLAQTKQQLAQAQQFILRFSYPNRRNKLNFYYPKRKVLFNVLNLYQLNCTADPSAKFSLFYNLSTRLGKFVHDPTRCKTFSLWYECHVAQ
ncbi:hypothetical protein ALC57_18303 [Trachymyrmex cornetzi]|uniref:Uncharacterized protein n=1 Tax=Trachymyrmex cornetzi TaxID=471704 RepID=A0A151IS65_9HYME|nr:hypothetical protein ALC57_18303 [Trachymyrmex cornetzi]